MKRSYSEPKSKSCPKDIMTREPEWTHADVRLEKLIKKHSRNIQTVTFPAYLATVRAQSGVCLRLHSNRSVLGERQRLVSAFLRPHTNVSLESTGCRYLG